MTGIKFSQNFIAFAHKVFPCDPAAKGMRPRQWMVDSVVIALSAFAFFAIMLFIFSTTGSGSHAALGWQEHEIDPHLQYGEDVTLADMDGDGDLDAVVSEGASYEKTGVWWYENPGRPYVPWLKHAIAIDVYDPFGTSVIDMDGDGDFDVVVCLTRDNTVVWYENGNFWHQYTITDKLKWPRFHDIVDIDKDGIKDIVVGTTPGWGDGDIYWIKGPENPRQDWPESSLHVIEENQLDGVWNLKAFDVNRDGHLDVIANDPYGNRVVWYESPENPEKKWKEHKIISIGSPRGMNIVDLNADGRFELVISGYDSNSLLWFEIPDNGSDNWVPHYINPLLPGAYDNYPYDMDGDGDLDIIATGDKADDISWYELVNLSQNLWIKHQVGYVDYARCVWAGDIDGDGDMDIIVSTKNDSYERGLRWFENLGVPAISGILFNTTGRDTAEQWVEITPPSVTTGYDLNDWVLTNSTGVPFYRFPDVSISSDEKVVVHLAEGVNYRDGKLLHLYTAPGTEVFDAESDACGLFFNSPSADSIADFVSWSGGVPVTGPASSYAVVSGLWPDGGFVNLSGKDTGEGHYLYRANKETLPTAWSLHSPQIPIAKISSISPLISILNTTVSFSGKGESDYEPIVRYVWNSSADGELYNGTSPAFQSSSLSRGNHTITLQVMDAFGHCSSPATANIQIRPEGSNLPPVIDSISISSTDGTVAYKSSIISAVVSAHDPNGDNLSFFYTWFVNGKKVSEVGGPSINGSYFNREDVINFSVVVSDGKEDTTASLQDGVVVQNSPPVPVVSWPDNAGQTLLSNQEIVFDATRSYDIDGNALTFRYVIDFEVASEKSAFTTRLPAGEHNISLIISDGFDITRVYHTLNISLPPGPELTFSSSGIMLSNNSLETKKRVLITVVVQNNGDTEANATVYFYIDSAAGRELGTKNIHLLPRHETTATIDWTPEESGDHVIIVVIKNSTPAESDETNNQAELQVSVAEGTGNNAFPLVVPSAIITVAGLALAGYLGGTETGRYRLLSWLIPLYTRISKEEALGNFTRGVIYEFVRTHPGLYLSQLVRMLSEEMKRNPMLMREGNIGGISQRNIVYHLNVLEREGLIRSLSDGRLRRFYVKTANVQHKTFDEVIYSIITNNPGITIKQLQKLSNSNKEKLEYHLSKMKNIHVVKAGNVRHLYPQNHYEGNTDGRGTDSSFFNGLMD